MASTVTVTDPERAKQFVKVFGSATVPVKERLPVPQLTSLPGEGEGRVQAPCYFLDLERITPEQRENLIAYSMERFGMSREECEQELPQGFPILADSCAFTSDSLDFL